MLEGRVAIVTGGAQGIGREYSKAIAAEGAQVVVADLNLDGAKETVSEIEAAGHLAFPMHVDVSDRDSTHALAGAACDHFGPVTVLVNNAAIYHGMRMDPMSQVDIEYWRRMLAVNLDGALLMTQAVAPQMIDAKWGRVVNQSSAGAYHGRGGAYNVAKLGLVAVTQGFAAELGPHGITVNAIAPGPIFTEATKTTPPPQLIDEMLAKTPINRRLAPDAVNGVLLFLLSEAASWMTGQTLIYDGGYSKRL